MTRPQAVIAEDEEPQRRKLVELLGEIWPELEIVAQCEDGLLAGLVDPMLLVYFVIFYLLASLVYGGLMMSIGAAVNQVADAQSLMDPVMILLVAPYALVPFIGQNPNSTLSVVMTFVPPLNSFVVLARLASSTPPPLWQVLGAMAAGLAGAGVAVWFAAKVFKIGLLMQGKPPNFGTLVKWARLA